MIAVRVETMVESDGELHLTELPCRRGDKVEAIVLILEPSPRPASAAKEGREHVRDILDRIRRDPIVPTPGTPDSVELLREDRNR